MKKAKIKNEKEEPKKPKNDIVIVKLRENGRSGLPGAMFSITNKNSKKKYTPTVKDNKSDFDFMDLDDGDYILEETETPKGYKGIAPIEFNVKNENGEAKVTLVKENKDVEIFYSTVQDKKETQIKIKNHPETPIPEPPTPTPPKEEPPLIPLNVNISVSKNWDGVHDDNISIKVFLVKNGVKTETFVTLNQENYWMNSFKNLPIVEKVGDKEPIKYTVEEENTKDGKVTIGDQTYKVTINSVGDDEFYITNKNITEPPTPEQPEDEKRNIKVNKVWLKEDGSIDTEVQAKLKIALYVNGKKVNEVELSSLTTPKYEYEFKDLPKFDDKRKAIQYRVEEITKFVDFESKITGDVDKGFTITNKRTGEIPPIPEPPKPPTPPTIDIPQIPLTLAKTKVKVEKVWEGISKDEAPEVTVYLLKNGARTDESIELNKQNNWMGEFKNLDVVNNITDKQENKYTVEEKLISGYKTVITGDAKTGFVITNIKDKPNPPVETPEKPNKPNPPVETSEKPNKANPPAETPEKPSKLGRRLPQTGDGVNITLYAGLMAISGSLLLLMEFRRRKNKNVNEEK